MQIASDIYTIPNFLSPEECQELIDETEAIGYEAAPVTTISGPVMIPNYRNNTRVMLDEPEKADKLWKRLRSFDFPAFYRGRQAIGLNERLRYYRYEAGEKFAPHRDGSFRRDNGESSQMTFMIYLSEGFEGGETIFSSAKTLEDDPKTFVLPIVPKTGMALIFEHLLHHEGAAVRSGQKYVLRSDVMFGRPGQVRSFADGD